MNSVNKRISDQIEFNKVLVVGHPLSGYEEVADLLNMNGMSLARPSKRERMEPMEITMDLLKAHQRTSDPMLYKSEIEQLDVSPVWNGLALDLMLGNIDQSFWGWADPNAISLLDYWKSLDSQLVFILVYDSPQERITQTFSKRESIGPEEVKAVLDNWGVYNEALLKFYYHNAQRCLLVHTQQIEANSNEYLRQVSSWIGVPLLSDTDHVHAVDEERSGAVKDQVYKVGRKPSERHLERSNSRPADIVRSYLALDILQQYPDTTQLYEELQSVATIPLDQVLLRMISSTEAWSASVKVDNDHQGRLLDEHERIHALQSENHEVKNRIDEEDLKNEGMVKENRVLLKQLHHLQEEMENYYLENQDLKKKVSRISPPVPRPYGAAKLVKNQLDYRLGAVMVKNSRSLSGWITMPASLRREKEQFEREKGAINTEEQIPISQYADAHEAERIKRHLSFRLGYEIIDCTRTPLGWFRLPWALLRAHNEYRQSR